MKVRHVFQNIESVGPEWPVWTEYLESKHMVIVARDDAGAMVAVDLVRPDILLSEKAHGFSLDGDAADATPALHRKESYVAARIDQALIACGL